MSPEVAFSKLSREGAEALSEEEILGLLVGAGRVTEKVRDCVRRVVAEFPEGASAGFARLRRIKGLGLRGAATLAAAAEFARRGPADPRPVIDTPRAAAGAAPLQLRTARKEHFMIMCLNARRQLALLETVSIGTLSASLVHPREVFSPAIVNSCAAVIALHNHPSGDTSPSEEDREVTRRLQRAGEILGIPLSDHIIVSASGYFSFRESGLIG